MVSDHIQVQLLAEVFKEKGIDQVIFSPGSRNAPLVITFNHFKDFQCLNIPDERVAAFFALGVAQQSQKPVAICCTSGTAALNYAPALAEAYYQKIPLIALTADRPKEWIDQGIGQSMRQSKVFQNFVKFQCDLPSSSALQNDRWYTQRLINEAIEAATSPSCGPVHINIPLDEPLYRTVPNTTYKPKNTFQYVFASGTLPPSDVARLIDRWKQANRKLILVGQSPPNPALKAVLEDLANDPSVVILTESTANVYHSKFLPCIDRVITTFSEKEKEDFSPDLLITVGGAVISKKIKTLLNTHKPNQHWHLHPNEHPKDTFQCLTEAIFAPPAVVLKSFLEYPKIESQYADHWRHRNQQTKEAHLHFLDQADFSDLKAHEMVLEHLPSGSVYHLGNSASVRYVQLFDQKPDITYFSNRGVSGIDGCTSTAAGYAWLSEQLNVLVSGELSFLYDTNALWNPYLKPNLRIIVVNNDGGGIFRIIDGPSSTPHLETHFDTSHPADISSLAKAYQIGYFCAADQEELSAILPDFFSTTFPNPQILEIKTPKRANDQVLKAYFQFIKECVVMLQPNWETIKTYQDITYRHRDGVARIAFNRPEVRNAFRPQTVFELLDAFHHAHEHPQVGVILLSGEGTFTKRRWLGISALVVINECATRPATVAPTGY